MLNPNSLKAKPADNYDDLKKQFFALKNLCESKNKECSIYSKKLAEHGRESILARSEALESEKEMNAQLTEELAKANERVINSIIEPLFKTRWSGDLSSAPASEMREQLFKTLRDQTMGYWSGHTAYNIAVDGGFLINDKKGANKRLTSLGAMFVEQEQLRKEQSSE